MTEPNQNPETFLDLFPRILPRFRLNVSVGRLARDIDGQVEISAALKSIGQRRFTRLVFDFDNSRIAIPLYAGDGLVVKVIPTDYVDALGRVPLLLPSISRVYVETKNGGFVIKTYPLLSQAGVGASAVASLKRDLAEIGVGIIGKDDHPRNVGLLPDKLNTPVGIDSDMLHLLHNDIRPPADLVDKWMEYISTIFPIYRKGVICAQSEETNFSHISIASPEARNLAFDINSGMITRTPDVDSFAERERSRRTTGNSVLDWLLRR